MSKKGKKPHYVVGAGDDEGAWDEQDVKDLIAERDKWKTDHELLVDDYKQLSIDLSKKDAEIKILEAEKEALQSTVNWYMENE